MSPEDKKRIQQEGESFAYSMSPMVAELASMYYQAYIAGAEAEFNRQQAEVAKLKAQIEDLETRSFPKPGTEIPCNQ